VLNLAMPPLTIVHILVRPLFTYVTIDQLTILVLYHTSVEYARTVRNVDIVGSSKCHTRHLATGGVVRFNYVLATNSNPVMTCASD
jgi:hypothetical protein